MKEIQNISLSAMKNAAHFSFHEATIVRLKALSEEATALLRHYITSYAHCFAKEEEAFKVSQKSLLTNELVEADHNRDRVMGALSLRIEGWTKLAIDEYQIPAKVLKQALKDLNYNSSMQMDQESAVITHLVQEWPVKYKAEVEKLGMGLFIEQVKVYNDQVKTILNNRTDEMVVRMAVNMKEARENTDSVYREMIDVVNAHLFLEDTSLLDDFGVHMNAQIKRYKEQAM